MRIILFCLIVSFASFGQNTIQLRLKNITSADSLKVRRTYTIAYSIKNISDQPVTILLDAEKFTPATSGSMTHSIFYKVYEGDNSIDAPGILTYNVEDGFRIDTANRSEEEIQKIISEYLEKIKSQQQERLLNSKIRLEPNETKSYSKELHWDFERYQKHDENEFYIDPNAKHYFEISLILLREEYESRLTPEQFATLMADKSLIKGHIVSNKMEIDFSE